MSDRVTKLYGNALEVLQKKAHEKDSEYLSYRDALLSLLDSDIELLHFVPDVLRRLAMLGMITINDDATLIYPFQEKGAKNG
jgi:hypothetical protein